MMKISIIVPVYNVTDYIVRCWDSIRNHSYKNLEVLFVDDCGTDDSIAKLDSCIASYEDYDVRILHHSRNRGLSAARNTGLEAATGDYVYFLDSDDDITSDCIELLVTAIGKDTPSDIVIGGYSLAGEVRDCPPLLLQSGRYCSNGEILRLYAEGKWYMMAWNKLCRKDFLLNNQLYFEEGLIHEDVLWSFQVACCAETMSVVNIPTYVYTIRANSIMTAARIDKDAQIYAQVYKLMTDYVRNNAALRENTSVYNIIEGRKSTLLFSLLERRRRDLYKKLYPQMSEMCYMDVAEALKKRIVGAKTVIRDLHYIFPRNLGRLYKSLFYLLAYKVGGIKLEGTLW